MKLIKRILTTLSFAILLAAPVMTLAAPEAVGAIPACDKGILTIPPWYRNLTDADCNVLDPSKTPGGLSGFIWTVVLNVIEIGLNIVGYAALFFILYGGFQFITGGGNASQVEKARKTITNAAIGLIISIASIGIVNLIFKIING